ncbi:MAG: putative lipid II flippase FtsW [bacterium]
MEQRQKQKKAIFYKHRPDYMLTLLVLSLVGIGLVLIYSTGWIAVLKRTSGTSDTNSFFITQSVGMLLGIMGWYAASKIDYHFWQKHATPIFIATIVLMFLVLVPGLSISSGGASRWVKLAFFSFQPVEFFKIGAVIFMAAWLAKNKKNLSKPIEGLVPFLIIIFVIAFLAVLIQKDMGSAMVIISTMLAMYFVSGVQWWNATIATLVLGGGAALLAILAPYRIARLTTFFNHSEDASGAGYHINQALIAIGSGGIFGRGLGKSLQAYGYLPEATNDSIFAIIGEEFGLVGTTILITAFALLFWRGVRIARTAPDNFGRLLASGIIFWITFQALINISAMLNLIPLTGITLPFISYGGTSILALLTAVGILQNISKYTYKEVYDEDPSSGGRNSRAHIAGTRRHRVTSRA